MRNYWRQLYFLLLQCESQPEGQGSRRLRFISLGPRFSHCFISVKPVSAQWSALTPHSRRTCSPICSRVLWCCHTGLCLDESQSSNSEIKKLQTNFPLVWLIEISHYCYYYNTFSRGGKLLVQMFQEFEATPTDCLCGDLLTQQLRSRSVVFPTSRNIPGISAASRFPDAPPATC